MNDHSDIAEAVVRVRERIALAARRSGRKPEDVLLVAVSKTVPAAGIREAIAAGITEIGENRVQEAAEKHHEVQGPVRWHLVGHLQTNKAGKALEIFDWIHSIDSLHVAQAVGKRAQERGKGIPVLMEVNTSGEASKYGITPKRALEEVEQIGRIEGIEVKGLMTVGLFGPEKEVRGCFHTLRELREEITRRGFPGVTMEHLSMGMTSDFEAAIEEGATMVRIGTAIFGARS